MFRRNQGFNAQMLYAILLSPAWDVIQLQNDILT
jgi:hypothetical protein